MCQEAYHSLPIPASVSSWGITEVTKKIQA